MSEDKTPKPVEIVCTLDYPLNAKQAKAIEVALRRVVTEVCPDATIRGLWVHERI